MHQGVNVEIEATLIILNQPRKTIMPVTAICLTVIHAALSNKNDEPPLLGPLHITTSRLGAKMDKVANFLRVIAIKIRSKPSHNHYKAAQ